MHRSTGSMGIRYIGNRAQDVMGYRGMRHMGNEAQGVWHKGVRGTWAMGHIGDGVHWHNNARSRSRCQNLRLPYFFLISELNTCLILMFEYSFQSLGPPLQESELKLPLEGL